MNARQKRYWGAMIQEIGVPVPFDLSDFCARLERQRGRPIRVIAVADKPDVPSGLLVSTADIDYIYYPEGLSLLHRTHIVLHEIAHMLLGHQNGWSAPEDLAQLVAPDVGADLVRLMLGRSAYTSSDEQEAEIMASLTLERAIRPADRKIATEPEACACLNRHYDVPGGRRLCMSGLPWASATAWPLRWLEQWRSYRELRPLWSALHLAVPDIALPPPRRLRHHIGFRLYRRVIEIHDGQLALRPYWMPDVAEAASLATAAAGLSGYAASTVVRAAVLAAALRAVRAGHPALYSATFVVARTGTGLDLASETTALRQLSRACRSQLVRDFDSQG